MIQNQNIINFFSTFCWFSRLLRWLHLSRGKSGTARAFGTNWVRTGTQNIWVRWVVAAGQRSHLLLWPESPQWSSGFDQTKLSALGKFLMTWQTRDLSLPNFEGTTRIPEFTAENIDEYLLKLKPMDQCVLDAFSDGFLRSPGMLGPCQTTATITDNLFVSVSFRSPCGATRGGRSPAKIK